MPPDLPQPHSSSPPNSRILRLPQVIARVGLSRASIYQYMAQGHFPRPIAIGQRARGWLEDEITIWIEARIQAGRSASQSRTAGPERVK